jgi:hypothetical protein
VNGVLLADTNWHLVGPLTFSPPLISTSVTIYIYLYAEGTYAVPGSLFA